MKGLNDKKVLIVGCGLAGSDAAYYLAQKGIRVVLLESKRVNPNPAQKLKTGAELVCTNSLKSKLPSSSHGLLKLEMKALGSLVLRIGDETAVPAGDALAVDRELFSSKIEQVLKEHPLIEMHSCDVEDPKQKALEFGCSFIIIATGPLTTSSMEKWIRQSLSDDDFYFYDAIAPVVDADSLDYSKLYYKDRHKELREDDLEGADYLNAPMNKEQYDLFVEELINAEKVPAQNFEKLKYFESCLPVDTMATRGKDTPRFSCMKPIGLENKEGNRPYAVVQLRRENLLGSAFNMVGFQTRLTYKEQLRVFRMIPGLEEASFNHLGSIHRNSFINARKLLRPDLSCHKDPQIYFAGQITGVEGYTESASMGLYVAWQIERRIKGLSFKTWPLETAIGALVNYIMTVPKPSPSSINFGLLPSIKLGKIKGKRADKKKLKKEMASERAKDALRDFLKECTQGLLEETGFPIEEAVID
jgi:methylenetetrahydrofolate--tRNA-(uracil-5-)-methyltransferase